jgi:Xaa-Pro aminopeptidase
VNDRLAALRRLLTDRGLDAVLVSGTADVRYLSGFRGDDAILLVAREHAFICSDSRYWSQIADEVSDFTTVPSEGGAALVSDALSAWSAADGRDQHERRLGFQGDVVAYTQHRHLRRLFGGRLVNVGERLSALREVKDVDELKLLGAAAAIADAALEAVVSRGLRGHSEREVAWAVEQAVRAGGAEAVAFATIVATGPHGALPHAIPGDALIADGDLVVIDMGARLDGYHSDITRTFAAGRPTDEQRAVYGVVLEAQLAGLQAVRAGVACGAVDAAARGVIDGAGYGARFGHGTGHGVGLEIHEKPRVGKRSRARLAPGMVVTVEPGIYLDGRFGVRIEDTVVVTAGACERLTLFPKELRAVD